MPAMQSAPAYGSATQRKFLSPGQQGVPFGKVRTMWVTPPRTAHRAKQSSDPRSHFGAVSPRLSVMGGTDSAYYQPVHPPQLCKTPISGRNAEQPPVNLLQDTHVSQPKLSTFGPANCTVVRICPGIVVHGSTPHV